MDNNIFEQYAQEIFDELYKNRSWFFKRMYGLKNKEYDITVKIHYNGEWQTIAERCQDKKYGDFLVEVTQDKKTMSVGWLYSIGANLLFYGVGQLIYWIEMNKLRDFIGDNHHKFPERVIKKDWGETINIVIPWSVIVSENIGNRL